MNNLFGYKEFSYIRNFLGSRSTLCIIIKNFSTRNILYSLFSVVQGCTVIVLYPVTISPFIHIWLHLDSTCIHVPGQAKKRFMFTVTCPKWKFRVCRHRPFFPNLFPPRCQKKTTRQMKKILTFRTLLFQNFLRISQNFIFLLQSWKKRLGSVRLWSGYGKRKPSFFSPHLNEWSWKSW